MYKHRQLVANDAAGARLEGFLRVRVAPRSHEAAQHEAKAKLEVRREVEHAQALATHAADEPAALVIERKNLKVSIAVGAHRRWRHDQLVLVILCTRQ